MPVCNMNIWKVFPPDMTTGLDNFEWAEAKTGYSNVSDVLVAQFAGH